MKVYVDACNVSKSGAIKRIAWEVKYLLKSSVTVHLMCQEQMLDYLENIGLSKKEKSLLVCNSHGYGALSSVFWRNFVLPFILKRKKIDVLYGTTGFLPATKLRNIIYVSAPSTVYPLMNLEYSWMNRPVFNLGIITRRFFILNSVNIADKIILLSSFMKKCLSSKAHLEESILTKHARYPGEKVSTKNNYAITPGIVKLIYVSHISKYKDQDSLISALSKYVDDVDSNIEIHLTLVGDIEPFYEREFYEKIFKLSNKIVVNVTGWVDYKVIDAYYQDHDICINASTRENSPHNMLEAMLRAMPILCRNEDFNTYYSQGSTSVYSDEDELISEFQDLLNSEEKRRFLGQQAYDVSSRIDFEKEMTKRVKFITQY